MNDMMEMMGGAPPMMDAEMPDEEPYRLNPVRKNCVQEKDETGEWVDKECYNTPGQAQAELSKLLEGGSEEPPFGGFGG